MILYAYVCRLLYIIFKRKFYVLIEVTCHIKYLLRLGGILLVINYEPIEIVWLPAVPSNLYQITLAVVELVVVLG